VKGEERGNSIKKNRAFISSTPISSSVKRKEKGPMRKSGV